MNGAEETVGIVGAAVPIELVLAAGMRPVRVSGAPRPTPLADAYGISELDGPATAAFEQLLEGSFRFALIGSDTLPQIVLFQALREIQRVEPVESLPGFALVDLLHLPYRTTTRYDRGQLERAIRVLEGWSGRRVDDEKLRSAIEKTNEARHRQAQVAARRCQQPARISGVEALALVDAALTGSSEPPLPDGRHDGIRVYLTGSAHEDATVYELLESRGCVVVGEDHVRGGVALGDEIPLDGDPLDRLAEHYQFAKVTTRRSIAERAADVAAGAQAAGAQAVVSFTFEHDGTTPWDVPSLRRASEDAGLRFVALAPQRFGAVDPEAIAL